MFNEFTENDNYEENIDLKQKKTYESIPEPTNLRISTMTAVSSLSTPINLSVVGKYLKTIYESNDSSNQIEYLAYADIERGIHPKGPKKNKNKKPFYNQATVIIKLDKDKYVNVKIFVNGNLQVTGLKSTSDGKKIMDILVKQLKLTEGFIEIENNNGNIENVLEKAIPHPDKIVCKDFEIMLINSDYFCGYKIIRENLYKIMIKDYGLFSTFEPCIYPGVNIKYYWNSVNNNEEFPGVCQCSLKCNGKGDGKGNGNCKKITISAFQSGNVIITGARDEKQINLTYNFINSIFKKYYNDLKQNDIPEFDDLYLSDDDMPIKKKKSKNKVVMVRKSKIKRKSEKLFKQ